MSNSYNRGAEASASLAQARRSSQNGGTRGRTAAAQAAADAARREADEKAEVVRQGNFAEFRRLLARAAPDKLTKIEFNRKEMGALPPYVFKTIAQANTIVELELSACGLDALPPALGLMENLTALDLSKNPQITVLPAQIGHLTKLKELWLNGCGLKALPVTMGRLGSLRLLNLLQNPLLKPFSEFPDILVDDYELPQGCAPKLVLWLQAFLPDPFEFDPKVVDLMLAAAQELSTEEASFLGTWLDETEPAVVTSYRAVVLESLSRFHPPSFRLAPPWPNTKDIAHNWTKKMRQFYPWETKRGYLAREVRKKGLLKSAQFLRMYFTLGHGVLSWNQDFPDDISRYSHHMRIDAETAVVLTDPKKFIFSVRGINHKKPLVVRALNQRDLDYWVKAVQKVISFCKEELVSVSDVRSLKMEAQRQMTENLFSEDRMTGKVVVDSVARIGLKGPRHRSHSRDVVQTARSRSRSRGRSGSTVSSSDGSVSPVGGGGGPGSPGGGRSSPLGMASRKSAMALRGGQGSPTKGMAALRNSPTALQRKDSSGRLNQGSPARGRGAGGGGGASSSGRLKPGLVRQGSSMDELLDTAIAAGTKKQREKQEVEKLAAVTAEHTEVVSDGEEEEVVGGTTEVEKAQHRMSLALMREAEDLDLEDLALGGGSGPASPPGGGEDEDDFRTNVESKNYARQASLTQVEIPTSTSFYRGAGGATGAEEEEEEEGEVSAPPSVQPTPRVVGGEDSDPLDVSDLSGDEDGEVGAGMPTLARSASGGGLVPSQLILLLDEEEGVRQYPQRERLSEEELQLFGAVQNGDVEHVRRLLMDGDPPVDPNVAMQASHTPLHIAANEGIASVIDVLLEAGADVNAGAQETSATPLHLAVAKGHEEVAVLLIYGGASTRATDAEGRTPFDLARLQEGHIPGLVGRLEAAAREKAPPLV